MVLKITPKFNAEQIRKYLENKQASINRIYFETLQYIGNAFIKEAREKTVDQGGFADHTGNLRSSIGYVIMKDGKQIFGDFKASDKGTDRAKGVARAKSLVQQIAASFPKGYALICVAGMEYAAAVESKGKDVISGSSINAKKALIRAIEHTHKMINAA